MAARQIPLPTCEPTSLFPHTAKAGGFLRLCRYPFSHLITAFFSFYRFLIGKMGYIWYNRAINSLFFEIEYENRFSMGRRTRQELSKQRACEPGASSLRENAESRKDFVPFPVRGLPESTPPKNQSPKGQGFRKVKILPFLEKFLGSHGLLSRSLCVG